MAKIQTWQPNKLSSSAVGVPQRDQSGQILAQGVEQAASTAQSVLQAHQEKVDNLSAMSVFGAFDREATTVQEQLKLKHAMSPFAYTKEVNSALFELKNKYSKDLPSSVLQKFNQMYTNTVAQRQSEFARWEVQQDTENTIGLIKQGYGDLSLEAEKANSPEGLKAILDRVDTFTRDYSAPMLGIDPANKLAKDHKELAITNSMSAQLMTNPKKLWLDLQGHNYDKVISSSTLIEQYTHKAVVAIQTLNEVEALNRISTAAVESSNMLEKLSEPNGLDILEVNNAIAWAEKNKSAVDETGKNIVPPAYLNLLYSAREIVSNTFNPLKPEERAAAGKAFQEKWQTKLESFLNREKHGSYKDMDDVIGLYSDILDGYKAGAIDEVRFNNLKQTLNGLLKSDLDKRGSKSGRSKTLDESLKEAGKARPGWFFPGGDVYREGFSRIQDYVNKRTDLQDSERKQLKEDLLVDFVKKVRGTDQTPGLFKDEQLQKLTVKQAEQMANRVLVGDPGQQNGMLDALVYKIDPAAPPVRIGEMVRVRDAAGNRVVRVFTGYDATKKQPRFATPDEWKKALLNQ